MFFIKWPGVIWLALGPGRLKAKLSLKLTDFLGCASNWLVILVQHNANLLHQTNLLLIVALELSRARSVRGSIGRASKGRINFREETENILRSNRLGLALSSSRGGSRGRH